MVVMLMSYENGLNGLRLNSGDLHPPQQFFTAESGVDHNIQPFAAENESVASAAGAKRGNIDTHKNQTPD